MTCLTAPAPEMTGPSTAVVRKSLLPQTIGDECPRPAIAVFHLMFLVELHSRGRFFSSETPWPRGPRHCGQLSNTVKAQRMRTRANTALFHFPFSIGHFSFFICLLRPALSMTNDKRTMTNGKCLAANAIDILLSANVDVSIGNRRRCVNRFANRIGADNFVLWTSLDNERIAILARHQDLALESDR